MKTDIYEKITAKIIAMIDKGEIAWQKPWVASFSCKSGATKNPYSLLNQLLLGARPGYYYTFHQVKERGGYVKKGAKATSIFFYKTLSYDCDAKCPASEVDGNTSDTTLKKNIPYLKEIRVFHQEDIEGLTFPEDTAQNGYTHDMDATADKVIEDYVTREHIFFECREGDRAFYRPSDDLVVVPPPTAFKHLAEYYSTAFHELSHSTMTATRCDRKAAQGITLFGSEDYSREELVAEISAAMLCHRTGVDTEKAFRNSVAYLQSWRNVLNNDPVAIVWAASRAEKAARFIMAENPN